PSRSEEDLGARVRGHRGDPVGEIERGTGSVIDEGVARRQLAGLGIDRLDDLLSPVAHVLVPERRRSVEVLASLLVVDVDALPPIDDEGGVLDGGHVSEGVPERSHAREASRPNRGGISRLRGSPRRVAGGISATTTSRWRPARSRSRAPPGG